MIYGLRLLRQGCLGLSAAPKREDPGLLPCALFHYSKATLKLRQPGAPFMAAVLDSQLHFVAQRQGCCEKFGFAVDPKLLSASGCLARQPHGLIE